MSEKVLTDTFFESFDLHPLLQQGLADTGFTRCTPIQALTLPLALEGRDVAGQAQTGTGKTCAFLVAMMNRLLTRPAAIDRKDSDPRALIIAPTRELAIQIEKDARAIGRHTGLRFALIYGGVDYDKQRQLLRDGCDVIIATPGRMLDYYKQNVFGLNSVEVMVIDEADRMFDLGFIKDVRFIFRRLPAREQRQVLLFSATLSHRVLELAYEHMHNAEKLVVETDNVTADRVRQLVYFPSKEEKMPLLLNLLEQTGVERSIIFVNTKAAAERITDRLKRHNYRVGAISGDVPQVKRQKLLQRFQDGVIDMLVATDVAARGLHIPAVSHVFNYDLPQDAEDYVHRIGRTARLGAEGDALSFACDLYAMGLPDIEQYIGQKIPVANVTADLLIMPKPRPRADGLVDDAEEDAADAAASSPVNDKAREARSRSRSGGGASDHKGKSNGSSGQSRPPRERKPAAAVTASAGDAVAVPVPVTSTGSETATDAVSDDAARKRRRRRRGGKAARERTAGTVNGAANGERAEAASNGSAEPGRRPSRHVPSSRPNAPAPAAPATEKVGFFKRLGRLFGAR
ncbi:DEAD/DEAH box helicase [Pinirhizobacter sp.]|jgi:ATP-dependent RNA helicase RhlB|uniref:DEAD/DEAH box helicase n=1 Tax=Pinirhizobacter sp. TaxID=2950432 RepID=UPI002F416CBB